MKTGIKRKRRLSAPGMLIVLLVIAIFWISSASAENIGQTSSLEALRVGQRMYREGILRSGEPMQAVVKGDIPVAGTAFTCISCHMRGGLGSIEGRVVTPPITGIKLFRPLKVSYKGVEVTSMPTRRPAYTDESLAEAIRLGIDPSGRVLDNIMPRYLLEDSDMSALTAYLKALSAQYPPGASEVAIRFATVITDDVRPEEREALVGPLEDYVRFKNNAAKIYGLQPRQARMAESMAGSRAAINVNLYLDRWVLKGAPETWRSQLDEYYRKAPVFALLGGITKGEWKPIHKFSEDNQIPCLFPITDFPVVSETDWYTLYFSKGYYQEGEGAARYLNSMDDSVKSHPILQIVRDSRQGLALSTGFQETWLELGNEPPVTFMLRAGEILTGEFLKNLVAREKPAYIVLWVDSGVLPALESLAADRDRPRAIFVSSSYLGKTAFTLKEDIRDFTYIAYPFRLPQDDIQYARYTEQLTKNADVSDDLQMILKRTYSIIQVLTQALMDMRGNHYRDNFLDVVSMMADQRVPLFERLSFGPGQRYASKGCYIVQLSKGPNPQLVKKSDWVVH